MGFGKPGKIQLNIVDNGMLRNVEKVWRTAIENLDLLSTLSKDIPVGVPRKVYT